MSSFIGRVMFTEKGHLEHPALHFQSSVTVFKTPPWIVPIEVIFQEVKRYLLCGPSRVLESMPLRVHTPTHGTGVRHSRKAHEPTMFRSSLSWLLGPLELAVAADKDIRCQNGNPCMIMMVHPPRKADTVMNKLIFMIERWISRRGCFCCPVHPRTALTQQNRKLGSEW